MRSSCNDTMEVFVLFLIVYGYYRCASIPKRIFLLRTCIVSKYSLFCLSRIRCCRHEQKLGAVFVFEDQCFLCLMLMFNPWNKNIALSRQFLKFSLNGLYYFAGDFVTEWML